MHVGTEVNRFEVLSVEMSTNVHDGLSIPRSTVLSGTIGRNLGNQRAKKTTKIMDRRNSNPNQKQPENDGGVDRGRHTPVASNPRRTPPLLAPLLGNGKIKEIRPPKKTKSNKKENQRSIDLSSQ